ncbi:MAG: restriction endonuclease subunit S, partial [Ruminococcus sp.]|nr:restriction endonuclease subunit S [Ruminococcus sp.]
ITTLGETTSKFATGLNPRKNFVLGQGNNYYVTIKNMYNNDIILNNRCDMIDDEALEKINKRSDLKSGDVLFSGIGTIGRVYYIYSTPTNWNISESIFTIRANNLISPEYLYLLLLSSDMQNYVINSASGSVQKGIRMADLKKYEFNLPTHEVIIKFSEIIKPLIAKIKNNNIENQRLSALRDALLPELINGRIKI